MDTSTETTTLDLWRRHTINKRILGLPWTTLSNLLAKTKQIEGQEQSKNQIKTEKDRSTGANQASARKTKQMPDGVEMLSVLH
jgi:hypothetical protein